MNRLRQLLLLLACISTADAADYARNQALYVEMRDGVRIAIDVWLPDTLADGERLPTLIQATRYWRAMQHTSGRVEDDNRFELANRVNDAGYAFVVVDARGSGASFGTRAVE